MTYDRRIATEDRRLIGQIVLALAKQIVGPIGKKWAERARRDSTMRLVFTDDNGRIPARGIGSPATIEGLLQRKKSMPRDLPAFLEALNGVLRSQDYAQEKEEIKSISINWKTKSGLDEEWSIAVPKAKPRHTEW